MRTCTICLKEFAKPFNLRRHYSTVHSMEHVPNLERTSEVKMDQVGGGRDIFGSYDMEDDKDDVQDQDIEDDTEDEDDVQDQGIEDDTEDEDDAQEQGIEDDTEDEDDAQDQSFEDDTEDEDDETEEDDEDESDEEEEDGEVEERALKTNEDVFNPIRILTHFELSSLENPSHKLFQKTFRDQFSKHLVWMRKLRRNPTYKKIMKTVTELQHGPENYGLEEALFEAVRRRKYLLDGLNPEPIIDDGMMTDDDSTC